MGYSVQLRKLFAGTDIVAEDLLLLDSFQVKYLPDRVPSMEFSVLIRKYPFIKRFLIAKYPQIEVFINATLKENAAIKNNEVIDKYCDELVWEIADLIVYNKYPELYDKKGHFSWEVNEIISEEFLEGKVVADVGAGTGMLAFLLANYAKTVYAIEPICSFRNYIRKKANKKLCKNIYTMDGFLDSIPFPDNSFDILFTSNAIGWNLEDELHEIERVVKPNGKAIHLIRTLNNSAKNPFHEKLVSSEWKYKHFTSLDKTGLKIKYIKNL